MSSHSGSVVPTSSNSTLQPHMEAAISRVVELANVDFKDVTPAVIQALAMFGTKAAYRDIVVASIPAVIGHLSAPAWETRKAAVEMLAIMSTSCGSWEATNEDAIRVLVSRLEDPQGDVRSAVIRTLMEFSTQDSCLLILKNASVVSRTADKLADHDHNVCIAAIEAISTFGAHEIFQSEVKLSIPILVQHLSSDDWVIRRTVIVALMNLSKHDIYDTLRDNVIVSKVIAMVDHADEDVCVAAVQAMLVFGKDYVLLDGTKAHEVISNLVTKLTDGSKNVRDVAMKALVTYGQEGWPVDYMEELVIPTLVQQLPTIASQARLALYPVLEILSENDMFSAKISSAISKLLNEMTDDDLTCIRPIVISVEITGDDVPWSRLKDSFLESLDTSPGATDIALSPAVSSGSHNDLLTALIHTAHSKLIYDKFATNRGVIMATCLQIARNTLRRAYMGFANPDPFIEATSDEDGSVMLF